MKNIVHTIVRLRPDRLDLPLEPVSVGLFGSATLRVAGIPEDVAEPRITLTTPAGSTFEVYVDEAGVAYVEPGMLDQPGGGSYHVWATDAHGNPTPLGAGTLRVLSYPMSVPGSVRTAAIPVSSVMDENGVSRRLLAVQDSLGNWTLTVGDIVESSFKLVDPTKLPADAAEGDSMAVLKAKINAIKSAVTASCIALALAFPALCNAATLNDIPGTEDVYTAAEVEERINDVVTSAVKDAVLLQETDPTVPAWAKSPNPPDFSPSNATLVATIEATAPAPGDYAAVSNAAMTAVQPGSLSFTNDYIRTSWKDDPTSEFVGRAYEANYADRAGISDFANYAQKIEFGANLSDAKTGEEMLALNKNYTDNATNNLARVAHTGSYNDLSNKPTIPTVPTNVSAFNNDAGYLTSSATNTLESAIVPTIPNDITRSASDATLVRNSGGTIQNLVTIRQASGTLAGLMTAAEHNQLAATSSAVSTWEGYWDGTNVIFEVTNYYGNTSGEIPRLRIKELREGAWRTVWDEADKFQVCETNIMSNVVAYVSGEVGDVREYAAENFAPLAWGTVTDKGTTNVVGNSVWMTAPETYFAGGTEYQRVAVGSGSICVLTDNGALAKTVGEPGTFRFQDEGGTNYFGFAKSESYTIGCRTDGITVEGTLVTLRYDVIMGGGDVPIVYWRLALDSGEWVQLNNADGTATQGAPYTVAWYTSGGSYYAAINCGANASGFFKAETSVAGDVVFETNMKMRIDGGLSCPNTSTGVMGVIRPTFDGSTVIWNWSAR